MLGSSAMGLEAQWWACGGWRKRLQQSDSVHLPCAPPWLREQPRGNGHAQVCMRRWAPWACRHRGLTLQAAPCTPQTPTPREVWALKEQKHPQPPFTVPGTMLGGVQVWFYFILTTRLSGRFYFMPRLQAWIGDLKDAEWFAEDPDNTWLSLWTSVSLPSVSKLNFYS